MTTTFTTTINQMYCVQSVPNQPDYVVNCLFTVSGTDGTHTASIDGNIQFEAKQQADFVPYANLTESIVLGWINEAGVLPNLEACVQGQIDSQINPPVSPANTPLPWAK